MQNQQRVATSTISIMYHMMLISISIMMFAYSTRVEAQLPFPSGSCQPFTGAPLSQCGSVVNWNVFVPTNTTIAQLDALANQKTTPFRLGLTPKACSDAAMQFICSEAFHGCVQLPQLGGSVVAVPIPTCQTRCLEFNRQCGAILHAQGTALPDCNAQFGSTSLPMYPVSGIPLSPTFTLPCSYAPLIGPYQQIPRVQCLPAPSVLPLSQCHGFVNYNVYVPQGYTLSSLDAAAAASTGPVRLGIVPSACQDAAMRFICGEAFHPCFLQPVAAGVQLVLPRPTCHSTCANFTNACYDAFAALGQASKMPNCATISPLTLGPMYPETSAELSIGPSEISIPCNAPSQVAPYSFIPVATCQPFETPKYSQCARVVTWPLVYVQEGQTQSQIDFTAWNDTFPFLYLTVPPACSAAMLRYVCTGLYLSCSYFPVPSNPEIILTLPKPPCRSVCEQVVLNCNSTFALYGVPLPNCTAINPINGLELTPKVALGIPVGTDVVVVPCVTPNTTISVYRDCPGPFIQQRNPDGCDTPCPVPIYNTGENDGLKAVIGVMAGLTFITSILLIITFILDIKKHSFPENIPLWISIAAMGFAVGFLMGVIVGYTPVICDSPGWCKTQATFLVYFQFGLAGWMTVLAFNVFLVFTLKIKKKRANRMHLFYHVFAWGIGIPIIIIGLAVDRFDYIPPQLICFISAQPDGWPQLGLYTFPIFTLCALTMFFWLAIIWRIWKLSRKSQEQTFLSLLGKYWRIFLFLFLFLYIFLYNIEESLRSAINYQYNINGFNAWGRCVFAHYFADGCTFNVKLHYAPSFIFAANTSAQGLLVNLIFLTTPSTFSFWKSFPGRMLRLIRGQGFYTEEERLGYTTSTSPTIDR